MCVHVCACTDPPGGGGTGGEGQQSRSDKTAGEAWREDNDVEKLAEEKEQRRTSERRVLETGKITPQKACP